MIKNLTSFSCRLCRCTLDNTPGIQIGPFPKAAQYYPEPEEFSTERGVLLDLVECPDCGLTQLRNEPVDYYQQVITAASLSPAIRTQRLELFTRLRRDFPADTNLLALEIGCAGGDNLPLLQASGFSPQGIECDPHKPTGEISQGHILNRYLLDLGNEHDDRYDLLVSFNYLEHQPDARAFFRQCHSMLHADGRLLLTVPNLSFLLETYSGHEFVADHLVYFTADTLTTALNISGFKLLDLKIINNGYDIQIIASKRQISPIQAAKMAVDKLVEQLNHRLEEFAARGQKVAVWGAGHRTLALISLCKYSLIHCIIDSATFKHYRYAPLSHLQILPPETLNNPECGIDAILVMVPGIYPKEVVAKIRSLPVAYHAEQFPPDT